MHLKPTEEQYRTALRILTEGKPGSDPGVLQFQDPVTVAWAHVVLSQCVNEVALHRHKEHSGESK